jgi:hypothetical protein
MKPASMLTRFPAAGKADGEKIMTNPRFSVVSTGRSRFSGENRVKIIVSRREGPGKTGGISPLSKKITPFTDFFKKNPREGTDFGFPECGPNPEICSAATGVSPRKHRKDPDRADGPPPAARTVGGKTRGKGF